MKRLLTLLLCVLMLIGIVPTFASASELPFTDVKPGWYYNAVKWCYEKKYMSGVSDTTFEPGTPVNRAMFVVILAKIDNANLDPYTGRAFNDVEEGTWYSKAVRWAAVFGFASGVGDGMFAPYSFVTREQLAAFLCTYASKRGHDVSASASLDKFTDAASVSGWAEKAVKWAVASGMISGKGDGKLAPQDSATRAEIAVIIKKFVENIVEAKPAEHTHVFGEWVVTRPLTCTEDGYRTRGCECGFYETEVTYATGHEWDDGKVTVKPTVKTEGEMTYTCKVCGETKTEIIPVLDLGWEDGIALNVASDRQMFVEDSVLNTGITTAGTTVHSPEKQERAFDFNAEWERGDTVYQNISVAPDGTYRMYYKATSDRRRICYIESTDGINWSRPELDTYKWDGAKTNIVTNDQVNPDNMFVFYDTNPACDPAKHWKGIYGQWGDGLFMEWSQKDDGNFFPFWLNGTEQFERPMLGRYDHRYNPDTQTGGASEITGGCFFDSLNTVYWDAARGKYVGFVRGFHQGNNYQLSEYYVATHGQNITRDIRYTESDDFVNWTTPVPLKYSDGNDYQMYANAIMPYYRANGLYIGIPTRYNIVSVDPDTGDIDAYTDNLLMASRDLVNWTRCDGSPYMLHTDSIRRLTYGDSYPCVGMIETDAAGGGRELSLYMKEKKNYTDNFYGETVLYRYSLRIDGFVSLDGDGETSEVYTKPLTYTGAEMFVNYKANEGGSVRITIIDRDGNEYVSEPLTGDETDGKVTFPVGTLESLAGRNVVVLFELTDAELYSFIFE